MDRLKNYYTFLRYLTNRYIADGCANTAAALTYMSLFAVVPLLTVLYTMLSAIPSFQSSGGQIEAFIFDHFIPTTGFEIKQYLLDFSSQTRKLSGIGVVVLLVTAILMLKNIEKNFNAIWRTRDNRSKLSSFLLYWAILSLGPIFIGLAMGISTYLISLKVFADPLEVIGLGPVLLRLSPFLLTATALSLLFAAVPNCRVSIPHAIIGGLVTALVFEIAKQLFTRMVAFSSYELIYGAFAAIPLFLMWIYVSWLIVLAGAELVNALGGYDPRSRHQYCDITVSLGILHLLWQKHQNGEVLREDELLRQTWLFDRYTLSSDQWTPIRSLMLSAGLINISDSKDFMLGRDLHCYTLADLCNELGLTAKPDTAPTEGAPQWFTKSQLLISNSYQHNQLAMDVPLADLYEAKAV